MIIHALREGGLVLDELVVILNVVLQCELILIVVVLIELSRGACG